MQTIEPTVKSADRVFDVLELVARHPEGLGHTQIAQALGIPKGSLTHLLRNMAGRGYLAPDPLTKLFCLGPAIARLAGAARGPDAVIAIGRSHIDRLVARTDESASLNLLRDDQVERVYGANSSKALLYSMRVGDLMPLYATSAGKIFLAYAAPDWRKAYFERTDFVAWTQSTASKTKLRDELAKIAKTGLAFSQEEFTPGIVGLSRPVFDAKGGVIAAVNISLPSVRFDPETSAVLAEEIRRTCDAIAGALPKV